jgi:hypothetical protein
MVLIKKLLQVRNQIRLEPTVGLPKYHLFTNHSLHFHFTFNHISLSHTLTLNHFHDYMGFRHIIFQYIYFSVFE